MALLALEFPVRTGLRKPDFVAQATAWIKGMQHTSLFRGKDVFLNESNAPEILSEEGEILRMRSEDLPNGFVIGLQHEIVEDNRLWRTEITLTEMGQRAGIRSRTQCLANDDLARVQTPQKPHFVRMAIEDGWALADGAIPVKPEAFILSEQEIEWAADLINGAVASRLPIVYVSRNRDGSLPTDATSISRLAVKLGGIAHLFVEPSRSFANRLQSRTQRKNPYNGTIGISLHKHGVIRKFFLSASKPNAVDLVQSIYNFCTQISTNRKSEFGYDWHEIAELNASSLRRRLSGEAAEVERLLENFDETIANKDKRIDDLEQQLENMLKSGIENSARSTGAVEASVVEQVGCELFVGEHSDRLRFIVSHFLSSNNDASKRTIEFARKFLDASSPSGGGPTLIQRLSQAGRDARNADDRLGAILAELGFDRRHQGGHPVYSPRKIFGVETITLSSSSSDSRAGKNSAKQIQRSLGLNDLTTTDRNS